VSAKSQQREGREEVRAGRVVNSTAKVVNQYVAESLFLSA
jgi:hypothetical protein